MHEKFTFHSKERDTDDMTVHEHGSDLRLRPDWENNARYRMMEDKHEDCTSEDIGYMRHLLRDVEDWGSMNSVCDKVVRRGTIKTSNDYKSKDSSENLKAF